MSGYTSGSTKQKKAQWKQRILIGGKKTHKKKKTTPPTSCFPPPKENHQNIKWSLPLHISTFFSSIKCRDLTERANTPFCSPSSSALLEEKKTTKISVSRCPKTPWQNWSLFGTIFGRFFSHSNGNLARQLCPCPFLLFIWPAASYLWSFRTLAEIQCLLTGPQCSCWVQLNSTGSEAPRTTCSDCGLHVQDLQSLWDLRAGVNLAVHPHQEGPVQ